MGSGVQGAYESYKGSPIEKDGKLQFGLAIEFKSWDDALAVAAFGIYFFILWPEMNQADIIAILVLPQDILLNIKTYGPSNCIGYNQWR